MLKLEQRPNSRRSNNQKAVCFLQMYLVLLNNHNHYLKLTAEQGNHKASKRQLIYLTKGKETIRQQWEHQGNHVGGGGGREHRGQDHTRTRETQAQAKSPKGDDLLIIVVIIIITLLLLIIVIIILATVKCHVKRKVSNTSPMVDVK